MHWRAHLQFFYIQLFNLFIILYYMTNILNKFNMYNTCYIIQHITFDYIDFSITKNIILS